jgi:hypothetical protein
MCSWNVRGKLVFMGNVLDAGRDGRIMPRILCRQDVGLGGGWNRLRIISINDVEPSASLTREFITRYNIILSYTEVDNLCMAMY